jgi:hypothetical protein
MRWIVAIFFVPILGLAQPGDEVFSNPKVASYLQAYRFTSENYSDSPDKIFQFLNKLAEKRQAFKNEELFLSHVFTKTHQRFLKRYTEPSSFNDLLINGSYNCLTGTAFYALILEHLRFRYQVIETNHHIFLLVTTKNGQILFEATDALAGFESNQEAIGKKISDYRKNNQAVSADESKTSYQFAASLYNSVNLDEILGLLHYNLSVQAYNKNDLRNSVEHLEKASRFYTSSRIEEFTRIVSLTILERPMQQETRNTLLKKINAIQNKHAIVASTK